MLYTAIAGLLGLIALLIVLLGLRLLLRRNWLLGWLRGMVGLVLLGLAVFAVLVALDLYSYKQLSKEHPLANLSFTRLAPQHYQVNLVDGEGDEHRFELYGDLWQLDARIIKWNDRLARLGVAPGYRLDRISGRYLSLEEEQTAPRSVHSVSGSNSTLDVWQWLRQHGGINLMDASYGSATYLPMADGALFAVTLAPSGLVARPLNARAKSAVEGWQ